MATFIARRILLSIPLLWAVLTLTFIGFHLLVPGNPAEIMLFGKATKADIARVNRELGLDQPLPVQYWKFISGAVHLDFGTSLTARVSVTQEITQSLPTTLELALGALFIATIVGVVGGVLAALFHRNAVGAGITALAVVGFSVPEFIIGVLAGLVIGLDFGWLPLSGTGTTNFTILPIDLQHLVLPAACLAVGLAASLTRLIRATMLTVLGQDYIRTATAYGVKRYIIIFKHAFRNALLPVITVYGLSLAALLSGAVIIENIFGLQGLGTLALTAINRHDYPTVEGTTFLFAAILVTANLLVDITYSFVDPRVTLK